MLPVSNDALPRTIGSVDKSKSRKAACHKGPFGLTTFAREDDEESSQNSDRDELKQNTKIYTTTTITVTSDEAKGNSLWGSSGRCHNESEEQLNRRQSSDIGWVLSHPTGLHREGKFGEGS